MINEQLFKDIKLSRKNTSDSIRESTNFLIANADFDQYMDPGNVINCEDDICLIRNNIKNCKDRVLNKRHV